MIVFATAVLTALFGTFVEYWGHRLMHQGRFLRRHHAKHHQHGSGQGWLREFRDYGGPVVPLVAVALWLHVPVGIGVAVGGLGFAAVAAWAHQLQHEHPRAVRWMPQPQHAVHHHHREWHHNFGITVDWWDRVFGTYRAHPPLEIGDADHSMFDIHWVQRSPALPRRQRRNRAA